MTAELRNGRDGATPGAVQQETFLAHPVFGERGLGHMVAAGTDPTLEVRLRTALIRYKRATRPSSHQAPVAVPERYRNWGPAQTWSPDMLEHPER